MISMENSDRLAYHNERKFSTKERDNDQNGGTVGFGGAWWYNSCHFTKLSGLYLGGPHETNTDGIEWYHWRVVSPSQPIPLFL